MQKAPALERMSIRVSGETHAKLKEIAKRQGRTLQSILLEAVTQYIEFEEKRIGIVPGGV